MPRYLKHDEIDPAKWDACIERAPNGLIYAYSFYLDHLCEHWDGLILNDYEAVMPLPWRKKFGIAYLYQPTFIACGGVFGSNFNVNEFIEAIPKKFKLVEINLNAGNAYPAGILRNNFILPLNASYDEIYAGYRDNIKRNIKKAIAAGCVVKKDIDVTPILQLSIDQLPQVHEQTYVKFRELFNYLHAQKKAITYGVFNQQEQLLASCVYFFSHNRAYYILVGNHPNGKTIGASHYLIDRFIADHAGSGLILDFEGSDIRNLAFFYSSFGAKAEVYPAVRVDRLPWYVRMLR